MVQVPPLAEMLELCNTHAQVLWRCVCACVCGVCIYVHVCALCIYVCKAKELPESTTDVVRITMSDQLAVDMRHPTYCSLVMSYSIAHWFNDCYQSLTVSS